LHNKIAGLAATALAGMLMTSASWAATDSTFLKDAIQGSIAEVKLGQLAQQNGGSDKVREFVEARDRSFGLERSGRHPRAVARRLGSGLAVSDSAEGVQAPAVADRHTIRQGVRQARSHGPRKGYP
jgi:putative membrane protein